DRPSSPPTAAAIRASKGCDSPPPPAGNHSISIGTGRPEVRRCSRTRFADMFFDGGGIGVEVGHSGFMGSAHLFLNCFLLGQTTAGLLTSNADALQQTVIGGNFQGCNRAIFAGAGSVPTIHGVGFQTSADCDIYTGTLSDNAMSVQGCRSESVNFI